MTWKATPTAPNPFFGTRTLKKAAAVHVKDDFNPFKVNGGKMPEPATICTYTPMSHLSISSFFLRFACSAAIWPFTGKRYMHTFPTLPPPPAPLPVPTPPVVAVPPMQQPPMGVGVGIQPGMQGVGVGVGVPPPPPYEEDQQHHVHRQQQQAQQQQVQAQQQAQAQAQATYGMVYAYPAYYPGQVRPFSFPHTAFTRS